jgi:hypothetical protein
MKELYMNTNIFMFVALLLIASPAVAQNTPKTTPATTAAPASAVTSSTPVAQIKTIGVPSATENQLIPSLIVLNARGAILQDGKLTLTGIAPNSIVFADRPVRAAGHVLTTHLLEEWATGNESFAADPPNATVSVFSPDGSSLHDAVVVLKSPKLDGDRLTFDVDVLEGEPMTSADGATAVFIDRFGFAAGGFGRGGFVAGGVGRYGRVGVVGVGHAGWYRGVGVGAAAVGGAALGAAAVAGTAAAASNAYWRAAPYYAPPACGYYPYPPC